MEKWERVWAMEHRPDWKAKEVPMAEAGVLVCAAFAKKATTLPGRGRERERRREGWQTKSIPAIFMSKNSHTLIMAQLGSLPSLP